MTTEVFSYSAFRTRHQIRRLSFVRRKRCTTQVHGIEDNINSDFHDGASLDMFTSDEDVEIPSHSTYIEARGDRGC
ncbi:hypothetical protein AAC387_Pa09g1758 [Persea americana]